MGLVKITMISVACNAHYTRKKAEKIFEINLFLAFLERKPMYNLFMETKTNPYTISAIFSTRLDAELAINLIAQLAYRMGSHIPKFEIVEIGGYFKITEIDSGIPE